jgi:hypothetical protein
VGLWNRGMRELRVGARSWDDGARCHRWKESPRLEGIVHLWTSRIAGGRGQSCRLSWSFDATGAEARSHHVARGGAVMAGESAR